MKLEIRCPSMLGGNAKVLIDGHDISRGLDRLELDMGMDHINEAVLTIRPSEIDIDVDAILALKAEARVVSE